VTGTDLPVLLLAYNRPHTTAQVFARIRATRPRQLFVAVDGPRPDRPEDAARCAAVRRMAAAVDWPAEVHTRFLDANLGCRRAASSAISWFFDHVEAGVVLEDDCLPETDFFDFCAAMLARYAGTPRVMHVAGYNPHDGRRHGAADYYYSNYNLIWGWASWRRAWRCYDDDPEAFARSLQGGELGHLFATRRERIYFRQRFVDTFNGDIDSWGYVWLYSRCRQAGVAIHPNANLITNIGFDAAATHTRRAASPDYNRPWGQLNRPLRHPDHITVNRAADGQIFRRLHCRSLPLFLLARALRRLRQRHR